MVHLNIKVHRKFLQDYAKKHAEYNQIFVNYCRFLQKTLMQRDRK